MKIVLDTNIWLSAFLFKGVCLKIVGFSVSHFRIYRSDFLEKEIREKLTEKFHLREDYIEEMLYRFRNLTYYTTVSTIIPSVCKDNDDNYILQICQSAEADVLITGDKELQSLRTFHNIKIISPSQFIEDYINNQ